MRVIDQPFSPMPVHPFIHSKYRVMPDPYRAQRMAPATVPELPYGAPTVDLPATGGSTAIAVVLSLVKITGAVVGGLFIAGLGLALVGGCG